MHRLLRILALCFFAFISLPSAAQSTTPLFSQSDLDQMLAPIALYPDDLLSNVLAAATYPLEVVQADRYVKQNPSLQGNALADALNTQAWDYSVKSLAQFPSVLAMMDDQLSWTEQLGDAFLAQQADVMDTVQNLRAKAQANGSLQSNPEQSVVTAGDNIDIQPAVQDAVYVPYYDPSIVYGIWWWPAQRPIFWSPPQNYRPYSFANISSGAVVFGGRVTVVGTGFNRYRPNWSSHTIVVGGARKGVQAATWQHDPAHRGNLAYRTTPSVNMSMQAQRPAGQAYGRPVMQQGGAQMNQQASQPMSQQQAQQRVQPQFHPAQQVEQRAQPQQQAEPARQPEPGHQASAAQHGEANHNNNNDPHKQNN